MRFLGRLEHERWCRFYISHGWTYADYNARDREIKNACRNIRQHNCLCPYDEMLEEDTKKYDAFNVRLGFIGGIVFGGKKENYFNSGVKN